MKKTHGKKQKNYTLGEGSIRFFFSIFLDKLGGRGVKGRDRKNMKKAENLREKAEGKRRSAEEKPGRGANLTVI